MRLDYHVLRNPAYVLRGGTYPTAIQGLKASGPLDMGACPRSPKVLFVYPKEMLDLARKLYLSLRDGLGPFRGTESLLGFSLPPQNVKRLDSFSTQGLSHVDAAKAYYAAVGQWLANTDETDRPDIALIIHPRTDRQASENPYLSSKFPLLLAGIPSQVVTEDILTKPETFQWSAATIALAMFAKMGGKPWAIDSQLADDSIIVGINRAIVRSREDNECSKYYGFASTFSHHGVYLGTRLFTPANTRSSYIAGLRIAINEALESWRAQAGSPVNLIVHVCKEVSGEETNIVKECLLGSINNMVRSFAILKVVEAEHVIITNPAERDSLPPPSVMLRLSATRGLLQVTGFDPTEHTFGKVIKHPLHIKLLEFSETAPSFDELCGHVLALCAVNWRGLNADASPATTRYPELVAELLGRFNEAGFDVSQLRGLEVMNRPWFL